MTAAYLKGFCKDINFLPHMQALPSRTNISNILELQSDNSRILIKD